MKRFAPTSSCFLSEEACNTRSVVIWNEHEHMVHLVYSYRFSPELYLIHNLTSVLGVLFRQEFTETVPLVGHRNTVLR